MMKNKKAFYLHGLESKPTGPKIDFLEQNFDAQFPEINYREKDVFKNLRKQVKAFDPDILIGSSMGGYFAFYFAVQCNIPALLFNPALPYRTTVYPEIDNSMPYYPKMLMVCGKGDEVIKPLDTVQWLINNYSGIENIEIRLEQNSHRTPVDLFKKYILNITTLYTL
jgi:hypothetical protein